jgi:hypothetical protein
MAWRLGLPLTVFAVVLLGIGVHSGSWALSKQLFVLFVGAYAIAMWGMFLQSAIRQNAPSHARLVPGLRRRLMVMVAAVYAAGALLLAALGAVVIGHFGYALTALAAFFPFLLLVQRHAWLSLAPSVVIFASVGVFKSEVKHAAMLATAYGEPVFTAVALALICLVGAASLQFAFPDGGDRHYAWRLRLGRKPGFRLNGERQAGGNRFSVMCSPLMRAGYMISLRRDSQAAAPKNRMMMYGLGPSIHAGGFIAAVVAILPVAWVAHHFAYDGREFFRLLLSAAPLQLMALMPAPLYAHSPLNAIRQSAAEQSLLRLTPGMPPPATLNRALGGAMLSSYLRIWGVGAVVTVLLGAMRESAPMVSAYTFASIALFLPPACMLLRDFAAARTSGDDLISLLTVILTPILFLAAFALSETVSDMPWLGIGLVILSATTIALAVLWRRLAALPPAFPAGRVAA